jgi:CheY-like chemotaxis protein
MKILIVDDEIRILGFLEEVLGQQGFEVLRASDAQMAMDVYKEHRPPFTLTDISMPGMTGLDLLKQIKALNQEAAVMLMTGAGTEDYAVEALRAGAINYFNKPVDINELSSTLTRYAALAEGYDFEHYSGDFLVEETLHLSISNDLAEVNHAVNLIVNRCRSIFHLSELFTLRFGLYEMVVNAIEHGNLGITYEEKSRALNENRLNELILLRVSDPERASRKVVIQCRISLEGLICSIRDEGEGFDHSKYSSSKDPSLLFEEIGTSLHGRGILLTSLQFDDIAYNDVGNEVTIVKKNTHPGEDLKCTQQYGSG